MCVSSCSQGQRLENRVVSVFSVDDQVKADLTHLSVTGGRAQTQASCTHAYITLQSIETFFYSMLLN